LAPVLSFTSDEAWQYRPQNLRKGDADSVHLNDFMNTPASWLDEKLHTKWQQVMTVREAVLGALEIARKDKMIGSALEAHPVITMPENLAGVDWAEICITSQATVKTGPDMNVAINKAEGNKCERCWKILTEVGTDKEFPTLSPRDADAVRYFLKNNQKAA
jgi:isoleucyl-tRNA synthetase